MRVEIFKKMQEQKKKFIKEETLTFKNLISESYAWRLQARDNTKELTDNKITSDDDW